MWLTVSQSNVHYDSALSDSKQTAGFFNGWLEGGKHFHCSLLKKTLTSGAVEGGEQERRRRGGHPKDDTLFGCFELKCVKMKERFLFSK